MAAFKLVVALSIRQQGLQCWRRIIRCGGKFCTLVFTPSSKTLISLLSGCVSDRTPVQPGTTSLRTVSCLPPLCVSSRICGRWACTRFCLCPCLSPDVLLDLSESV